MVRETETGLRLLGLSDLADWFAEAFAIVNPLRPAIHQPGDFYESLTTHGKMERIEELTEKARDKTPALSGSPIYAAWVRYAREHPQNVFPVSEA